MWEGEAGADASLLRPSGPGLRSLRRAEAGALETAKAGPGGARPSEGGNRYPRRAMFRHGRIWTQMTDLDLLGRC